MKKTAFLALLMAISAAASAQTFTDALNYSVNNYYGTARSIAIGNAMTAVGGDLGSITINPAGSAVAGYSQITLTPNISVGVSNAAYSEIAGNNSFGPDIKDHYTRFNFPNFGATFDYKTGKDWGLKSVTFGFIINGSSNYTSTLASEGANNYTTYLGALAVDAEGYQSSVLNNFSSYDSFAASWPSIAAYRSGMISTYGGQTDQYVGSTEAIYSDGSISLAGPITQSYGRRTYGAKYDIVLNAGFNINDNLFLGVNIGVPTFTYQFDQYIKEAAVDPALFGIQFNNEDGSQTTTYFSNTRFRSSYTTEGTGIYGKFGFIYKPNRELRLGAAIQTPTLMDITDRWRYAGETYFTDSRFDASDVSPEGEYEYRFISPFRFNVGAAYTFSNVALLSVDYEFCNYSTMKFRNIDPAGDDSSFRDVNDEIADFAGIAHNLRVGGEYKPTAEVALRAGYNLMTSPEYEYNSGSKQALDALTHAFSAGIGYSSKGSFFTDLSCRYTKFADEFVAPYGDYRTDVNSPEIWNKRGLWDITATIGFRF